jgi:hypothetical protein
MFNQPIKWRKLGRILTPRIDLFWNQAYLSLPTVEPRGGSMARIYFGGRDHLNRSRIGFADVDLDQLDKGGRFSEKPALDLGELGTFDDNGVMPASIVDDNGRKLLYYVGWNPRATTRFSFYCGLAISQDDGQTFTRHSRAPILERTDREPFVNASPMVIHDGKIWRMYYVSGEGWIHPDLPKYNIKYAESDDGRVWRRAGHACIDFGMAGEHALARPCVVKDGNLYRMWFACKGTQYDLQNNYRMGYAESEDGRNFVRRDDLANLDVSASGWDSEMVCYGFVFKHNDRFWMAYNGNNYGRNGLGLAVQSD